MDIPIHQGSTRDSFGDRGPSVQVGTMSWTVNQLIAYNLRRIRVERNMTQTQAREATAPFLPGGEWSRVKWSAAERSVAGKRIKHFDADEIFGLARGLGRPVGEFFRDAPKDVKQ